jgi:alkylation response protein AidB-like acyl-CoA dehydrogenase
VALPLLATVVSAALPLVRFGTDAQRERWLPAVVRGETILTAALSEASADPRAPKTRATAKGGGWRLDGVKIGVPYAERADALLVPAATDDGRIGVFLVERGARGMTLARQDTTNWEGESRVELAGVELAADALLGPIDAAGTVLNWIVDPDDGGALRDRLRCLPGAMRLTASTPRTESSSTSRSRCSRPSASAWPIATSTTRRSA